MVGLGRLELPTSPLSGVRSNHLSYRPGKLFRYMAQYGGACRDRTDDPLLAKQVLSQLSYAPYRDFPGSFRQTIGGSGWIRTNDPRLIKTVL